MLDEPSASWLRYERGSILGYASRLTADHGNPETVRRHATVLNAWIIAATDLDDRKARLAALDRADTNRSASRTPDDDPAALIAEAETYYGFIKAPPLDEAIPALVQAMPPGACDNWGG